MANKGNPGFQGELIGFTIKIVEAKNKQLQSFEGKVVDETTNTIVIQHDGQEIKILKDQIIKFEIIELGIIVEGRLIQGRPEERIKR